MDILAMSLAEHSFITAHPQEGIRRSNEMSFETDSGQLIMVTRSTSNKVYRQDRFSPIDKHLFKRVVTSS